MPSDSLGFRANIHADIIDPKNIKRTQLRGRYSCLHLRKKYTPKSTKDNFMARLKAVIDVTDLPPDVESHMFKVTKKSEWAFVKKVIYRTREKVHCSICLEEEMVASQITYCGHIFCFHCILMHFKKCTIVLKQLLTVTPALCARRSLTKTKSRPASLNLIISLLRMSK